MWPYDYFNQFSNIEIDSKIGSKKKVFLAIWYGEEEKNTKLEEKREAFTGLVNKLEINGIKFEPVIAKDIRKGDFNTNILNEILQSTFVVCDVTPTDDFGNDTQKDPIFNSNVMVELGLALGWKMPEQVIVLWDENDKRFPRGLASDIHNYHVDKIDAQYKGLEEIIKNRFMQFEYKRDILVKNVKSKIDDESLSFLSTLHGLLFVFKAEKENISLHILRIAMVRHLLNLGILRVENFPGNLSFAYCLNEIGRIVLKEKGVKLYPNILIDTYSLIHWKGYDKDFKLKYEDFKKAYNCDIEFEDLVDEFLDFIDSNIKRKIILEFSNSNTKYRNLDVFYKYLETYSNDFEFVNEGLMKKIVNSDKKYSRFFKIE